MLGKLITIEGLDGSGKQTQTALLAQRLKEAGHKIIQVSFPNYEKDSSILVKKYLKGDYSNQYDRDNLTFVKQMSSFYAVDRVSSFIEKEYEGKSLIQHLQEGTHVICDRYTTSNILHQSGNLTESYHLYQYIDWIMELEFKHLGLPVPDSVFYLDVEPEISVANIKERYHGEAKEDIHENIEHLQQVYANKDKIIHYCGWDKINCCVLGELLPKQSIHQLIVERVRGKYQEFKNI
jgi:thymidylate kinase